MRRGFFILPAAAIVGALALAGCTADEPAAKQAAPSSPLATATPTPTPPPPEGEIGELAVHLDVNVPGFTYYIPDKDGLATQEPFLLQMAVLLQWEEDRWMVLEGSGRTDGD